MRGPEIDGRYRTAVGKERDIDSIARHTRGDKGLNFERKGLILYRSQNELTLCESDVVAGTNKSRKVPSRPGPAQGLGTCPHAIFVFSDGLDPFAGVEHPPRFITFIWECSKDLCVPKEEVSAVLPIWLSMYDELVRSDDIRSSKNRENQETETDAVSQRRNHCYRGEWPKLDVGSSVSTTS